LGTLVGTAARTLNARIQALRVLGFRARARAETSGPSPVLLAALQHPEPRLRFEGVQALREARSVGALPALKELVGRETDPTIFYAAWQTMRWIAGTPELRELLNDTRAGVRRAGLLALLEDHLLDASVIRQCSEDPDSAVRAVAALWLEKNAAGGEKAQVRGRSLAVASGVGAKALPPRGDPTASDLPPVRIEEVLGRLKDADPGRGEWLFFHPRGAGCVQCHRLDGRGNVFGPDLATVGDRATAQHVIESMVNPNAVITEGFNRHTVETADGEVAGVLLEESGLSVTLGLASGVREVIAKSTIRERRTDPVSAMPSFERAMRAGAVADLAAFLLSRKAGSEAGRATFRVEAGEPTEGFTAEMREDRLWIRHDGLPAAEYVFRDDRIRRPYFANVRAPNGVPVTRRHPPREGRDAMDHDTMHPGLWMAFGDISGVDFWRNKGRMEHLRFLESPVVRDSRLTFATESRLTAPQGQEVCRCRQRFQWVPGDGIWLLVWDAEFVSENGEFAFGDQEEMGLGARVAT
ncbi:MAG: PmoA family protein, partial [Nitrospira sp.]|nr:PmoA family protein [Nitrospira sp.]